MGQLLELLILIHLAQKCDPRTPSVIYACHYSPIDPIGCWISIERSTPSGVNAQVLQRCGRGPPETQGTGKVDEIFFRFFEQRHLDDARLYWCPIRPSIRLRRHIAGATKGTINIYAYLEY